ncbi:hypothetical protein BS78_03G180800 [Paspalum vaginatum]|nr:hypothetical protein BS78_03G180800 [Paspalum vaginatum]
MNQSKKPSVFRTGRAVDISPVLFVPETSSNNRIQLRSLPPDLRSCSLLPTPLLFSLSEEEHDTTSPLGRPRSGAGQRRGSGGYGSTASLFEHHLFDEMPRGPVPMEQTSGGGGGGSRRAVVAPARVPRTDYGINDIPRDALLRVLSRLDARLAVRTCVLARRWRNLWRDMPSINATCLEFERDKDGECYESKLRFKKFLDRLLMLRNPVALDEFSLWYCFRQDKPVSHSTPDVDVYNWMEAELKYDCAQSSLWIRHALLCNSRSLEVVIWDDTLEINPAVFASEHLKSLALNNVALERGFFGQLQTGCTALERLALHDCPISDFEISSQTLKFLSIGTYCCFQLASHEQLSISGPNLIHLVFIPVNHNNRNRIPILKNMGSLVTACVSLGKFKSNGLADDIRQFLLCLSGVQKLEFDSKGTELMMGNNLQQFPEFNNLKLLTLGRWCLYPNLYGLIGFLHNSPNLEQLTLILGLNVDIPETLKGRPGNGSFACEHLETVEILCFEHDPAASVVKEFLLEGGIPPGQIHTRHLTISS